MRRHRRQYHSDDDDDDNDDDDDDDNDDDDDDDDYNASSVRKRAINRVKENHVVRQLTTLITHGYTHNYKYSNQWAS